MRMYVAAGAAALALGIGLLAAVGNGTAAGDKGTVWKPLVPNAEANDLIKYLGQDLENSLGAKPPKGLMPKEWQARQHGTALLIAVIAQSIKGGNEQQLAGLRQEALQAGEDIEKGQESAAKAKAAALANLKAEAKGGSGGADLAEKTDLGEMMNLFKLRTKGGLGFGVKPGASADGIEAKLINLGKRALPAATLEKESNDLLHLAYVTAALSEVTDAHTPKKKTGEKDPKQWAEWTKTMQEASLEMAAAVKAKDAQKVKAAASRLNGSCNDCHGVFRD